MIPLKDNIPNERFPFVTVALVLINVLAYLLSIRHGGSFFGGPSNATVVHDAAIPYDLTHPGKYCTLHTIMGEFGGAREIFRATFVVDGQLFAGVDAVVVIVGQLGRQFVPQHGRVLMVAPTLGKQCQFATCLWAVFGRKA